MRTTHFALVCALFTACAWGGDTGTGGDGEDDPPQDPPAAQCGDGTCAPSEVGTCASDCGNGNPSNPVCGNGTCEANESPATCASDCQASGPVCGDGTCDMAGGENSSNCAGDCAGGGGGGSLDCSDFGILFACASCMDDPSTCAPLGVDQTSCQQCFGGGGGGGGQCNFDGVCDAGEDPASCFDCQ